jgi:hypothetical protein
MSAGDTGVIDDALCCPAISVDCFAMGKMIFQITSGNVIGVVAEPPKFHPRKPRKDQYIVQIGVIDRDGGLPKTDAKIVIETLRDFCQSL